jgi:hypothetical protein
MTSDSELHSHPDAGELLDATIAFLGDVLTPAVPAEHAFHLRVAVNALRMVQREIADGGEGEAAHRERLAALGFADDAALATALRAGEVPADLMPQVRADLLADAQARLRVANPRFVADYDAAEGVTGAD